MAASRSFLFAWLDYEYWASSLWLDWVRGQRDPKPFEPPIHVMLHRAGATLKSVCQSLEATCSPCHCDTLAGEHKGLLLLLRGLLEQHDPSLLVEFKRQDQVCVAESGWAARHILNECAATRGMLRGLAHQAGLDSFPETDFVRWVRDEKRTDFSRNPDELYAELQFDEWANLLACQRAGDAEVRMVLEHVAWSQRLWLQKTAECLEPGALLENEVDLPLEEKFERNAGDWQTLVRECGPGRVATYVSGKHSWSFYLHEVVSHVVNHGVYHRAQVDAMLGLSEPQNDMALWLTLR